MLIYLHYTNYNTMWLGGGTIACRTCSPKVAGLTLPLLYYTN